MSTQTGSISFESTNGLHSYAKQNYATLSQIKGQFATCGTSASTAAKVATIVPTDSGWELYTGATVTVKFTNANTATTPTLNVNSSGAKEIRDYAGNILTKAAREWLANSAIALTYDGTYWRIQDSNLMERVHNAETSIDQTATSITSLASMNDTYTDPSGNTVENNMKSYVNQTANGITQTVSSTYATKTELSDGYVSKNEWDTSVEDEDTWIYRITGGSHNTNIVDGIATIECVKGNTIVWNQLVSVNDGTVTAKGLTITKLDGRISVSGTVNESGWYTVASVPITTHKYLIAARNLAFGVNDYTNAVYVLGNYTELNNYRLTVQRPAVIYDNTAGTWEYLRFPASSNDQQTFDRSYIPQVFDLTLMFGAGNEPATVTEFEALYPLPYYAYDAGSLKPVKIEGVESVGFNQLGFTVPWRSVNNLVPTFDASKSVHVLAGYDYEWTFDGIKNATSWRIALFAFDESGTRLTSSSAMASTTRINYNSATGYWVNSTNATYTNATFRPAFNGFVMPIILLGDTTESSYLVNPSIHFLQNTRNGNYTPYMHDARAIPLSTYFPNGLRGAGTAHDALYSDHYDTVVGAVDLGALNWTYTSGTNSRFTVAFSDAKAPSSGYAIPNIECASLTPDTTENIYDHVTDKTIGIHTSQHALWVYDSAYTDAATFKAAMDGVLLYYELATPTKTPITPPLNLTYAVERGGTESVLVDETADAPQSAPPVMSILYGINVMDALNDSILYSAGLNDRLASLSENTGSLEAPYTEVEWIESNGTQYVYTDWKPPIATWGFDIDFQNKNATTTTVGAWRSDTNINGYGTIFGTRNASNVNNTQLSSYSNGVVRVTGNSNTSNHGFKTDKTRQHMSYIGTTFTKPNGTTMTVNRGTETANKFYANMTIFACHEGLRRAGTGNLIEPSTTRIYSLKFYEDTEVVMDFVGAIRNRDGMTGLYDKVKNHFYPAPNMTYGNIVGVLGEPDTIAQTLAKRNISVLVDNRAANNSRMWYAKVPDLDKLEDGQQITVTTMANIVNSKPELTDLELYWDETRNNSATYYNVYLKLELADGSTTEWIPCYYAAGTRLTTHYNSGVPVLLTYHEDVAYAASTTSAGTFVMRGFWADPNYVDGNDRNNTISYFAGKTGAVGIWATSLFMEDGVGTYQNICTASDGTVTSNNRTTATTKIANTHGFKVGSNIYYTSTTYAANTNISGQNVIASMIGSLFDSRYSFNTTLTAGSLTAYKPIYLVGEVNTEDGLYYLDTVWWTQTPNTTGKVYVLIGACYDSTTSNCRITLYEDNPWYIYDSNTSKLMEFTYSWTKKNATDIIQTNESITTTAASTLTTAKNYADGKVAQEVIDRNSAIEQSASSITSTVAENYTTKTEFNNLEIGGRNLLKGWMTDVVSTSNGLTASYNAATHELHITGTNTKTDVAWSFFTYNSASLLTTELEPGADYTLTAYGNILDANIYAQLNTYIETGSQTGDWSVGLRDHRMTHTAKCRANYVSHNLYGNLFIGINPSVRAVDVTVKFKFEKGNKATDWSPAPEDLEAYTDTQVSSAKSEIKQTTDNITSTVEKINSAKYVNSSTASWTLANIKTYAAEGYQTTFNVTSTSNIRVGDTVYIKGTDSTRNCTVYIKTTVRAINSSTQLATTSHGYEDVLPVETIKSTINQSSDSVKIQAKHIEIDGTATFKNGNTTTTLGEYLDETYDAAGAADAVANVASTAALEEQYIYISKTSGTNSVSGNTTWVATNSDSQNTWTTKRPTYNSSYPVLFIAKQKKTVGGTVTCTTPVKDDTTTVIDGGHITTGTIDASQVIVTNINASNISTGSIAADRIKGNVISAVNNGTGTINADKINTSQIVITDLNGASNYATKDDLTDALAPIASKTYTGIIGTADNLNNASLYFAKVLPTSYDTVWQIKLRIEITTPISYQQSIDIMISGRQSSYMSYDAVVARSNAALGMYFINLYKATSTGISNNVGHALGFGLRASTNPANSTYNRTIKVDVLETTNCSITLLDTAVKYESLPGYNTTNYGTHATSGTGASVTELGVSSYGQNATNNGNTYDRTYHNNAIKAETAITAGRIICGTSTGYKNIGAGVAFDLSYPLLYSPNAISAGSTRNDTYITMPSVTFSNNGTITSGTTYSQLYLVGTINGNIFTIDANPFMTTVQATSAGKFYIPLGIMSSATAGYFESSKDLYAFIDGKFRQVTPTEIVTTHRIYYRSTTAIANLAAPTTWIEEATGNVYEAWTTKVPPLATDTTAGQTKYLYLYTCEQRKRLDGTIECTKVLLDENTTVIDGGSIITNSVAANTIKADSGTFNTANIPNLSAAKITSGDIAAARIQTNVVSAINATVNQIDAKNINVSEINIGDLAGEIGGRNYIAPYSSAGIGAATNNTTAAANSTPSIEYKVTLSGATGDTWFSLWMYDDPMIEGETYTLSFNIEGLLEGTSYTWGVFRQANGADSTKFITNTNGRHSFTFVFDRTALRIDDSRYVLQTGPDGKQVRRLEIDDYSSTLASGQGAVTLTNFKLEKGDIATAWTPAPEDVDSAINNASQIASNYIHADSTGINIYDSNLTNGNKYYLRQTAGGTYIYRNSYLKAKYEDTITLYGGSNASGANPKVELSSTQFKMTDSVGTQRIAADSTTGVIVGNPSKGRVLLNDTGLIVYDTNNKKRTTVNASGLTVYDASEVDVGNFAATARIGKTNSSRFLMNADSLQGYNSSNKLYFEVSSNGIKYGTDLSASGTTNTVETTSGAQAKIDSLSISSTNLIRNGDFTNGSTYWVAAGSTLTTESDSTYGKVLKVVTSSGEYRTYPDVNTNFTHVSGETYSISFYGKASAATTIYVGIAGATSGNGLYKACSFTTSWQKFTATITASAAGSLSFKTTSGATFYLAKVMLVHGSKSMDWDADPRDVSSELIDAKKHTQVIISAANVDYVANTCTLTARLYIDGVLQTGTSLKWQWYRDGTVQGSQTTGATGSLSVTSALGIAHRYSCKCTF